MTDRIALITGASRGLGSALAEALADTHHVVAVARTLGALEDLDDRIQAKGGAATLVPLDLTDRNGVAQLCRSIHDRWGRVDVWAHTAIHAAPLTPAHQIQSKDWDKSQTTNVTTTQTLIQMVEPLLPPDGTALFFDDPQGGKPFYGAYGATKTAQMALARSWQAETARIGPKVMIVEPAPMPTALRARFHPGEDRAQLSEPKTEAARLLAML